jgi:hypothetical protein
MPMSAIIDRGVVSPLDEVVEVPTGRFEGQEEHMHDLKGRTLRGGQISGDHHSMVGDENIARLARQINSVLDRYESEHNFRMARSDAGTDAFRSAREPRSDEELPQTEHAILHSSL